MLTEYLIITVCTYISQMNHMRCLLSSVFTTEPLYVAQSTSHVLQGYYIEPLENAASVAPLFTITAFVVKHVECVTGGEA